MKEEKIQKKEEKFRGNSWKLGKSEKSCNEIEKAIRSIKRGSYRRERQKQICQYFGQLEGPGSQASLSRPEIHGERGHQGLRRRHSYTRDGQGPQGHPGTQVTLVCGHVGVSLDHLIFFVCKIDSNSSNLGTISREKKAMIDFIGKDDLMLAVKFMYTDTGSANPRLDLNYCTKPIVRFAHQYSMRKLLAICEEHYMLTKGFAVLDDIIGSNFDQSERLKCSISI